MLLKVSHLLCPNFGLAHLSYTRELCSLGSEALATGLGVVEWLSPLLVLPALKARLVSVTSKTQTEPWKDSSLTFPQMFRPELLCVWEPQKRERRVNKQKCHARGSLV